MKIVFYDGQCGLCQRSIALLYKIDKNQILYFAPLNGETYKSLYGHQTDSLATIKFFNENETFQKSSAILEMLWVIGGKYKIFYLFKLIPAFIRDYLYDKIASKRNAVSCILKSERDRFLN